MFIIVSVLLSSLNRDFTKLILTFPIFIILEITLSMLLFWNIKTVKCLFINLMQANDCFQEYIYSLIRIVYTYI